MTVEEEVKRAASDGRQAVTVPVMMSEPTMTSSSSASSGSEDDSSPPSVAPQPLVPVIVQPPMDTYLIRGRTQSVVLSCKALYAERIMFKCNDEWVSPTERFEGVDPKTGALFVQATVAVTRQAVDSTSGCSCTCYASSSTLRVKSEPATVRLAYLLKNFYREPQSERKPLGSEVELQCLVPKGEPEPEVYWLKDGSEIKSRVDPNVIIAHDGSLLISSARLIDSGNYTCGARNVAHERLTRPAVLQIYVDGSWSQWSAWIDSCPTSCKHFDQQQHRTAQRSRFRVCDNPPPSNGGSYCPGADKQHEDCDLRCPVDGSWSAWTDWTQCNTDCHQNRHRQCDSPTPRHGGRPCVGIDAQQRNCSDANCVPNLLGKSIRLEENSSFNVLQSNMAMYAGLAAAVFVFLFAFLLLFALVLRRKTCHRCNKDYEVAPTSPVRVVASSRPDVAMHSPMVYDLAPSMKSDRSRVGLLAWSQKSDSNTYLQSSTTENNYATVDDSQYVDSVDEKISVGYSTRRSYFGIPCQRRCSNTECLLMSDRGISLFIPEGALVEQDIEVFLLISDNRPALTDRQTALTPTVWLGPAGLTFKKPAVLRIEHSAAMVTDRGGNGGGADDWQFTLYFNGSCDDAYSNDWSPVAVVGQETLNTSTYCQMDANCCHLLIDSSGKYTLVGESRANAAPVSKRCRLAVFMGDSGLRVYCIADTRAALQWTLAQEEDLCGRLCAVQSETLLLKQGSDLCLCLEGLSAGWTLLSASNYQEIPASHLWNSHPALHCTFSLGNKESIRCIQDFPLTATLIVCQKGSKSSRSIIQIDNEAVWNISETFHEFYAPVRLPVQVRVRLAALLDPPTESGNDWRMLARTLEVDHYLPYFASRPSPTDLILLLWESRQQTTKSMFSLMHTLHAMQREDAAAVINAHLNQV